MGDEHPGTATETTGPDTASRDDLNATRLTPNIKVLSWVSFLQDSASEMLYPVLPIFLTTVLGAPPAIVGLIEGVAEGTASIMKALSGRLADLRRRRPLVAAGYGLSSVSKLLIGFAFAWPMVLVARFTDRLGKGLRGPPRDAIIASDTTEANRGRAFGFHRAADTAGAVVGPLIGLGLYELMGQRIRPLFFVAFIPAALSVVLIFLVRERPHRTEGERPPLLSLRGFPARYWRLMVVLGIFAFVNFSDALLILRAKALGLGFVGIVLVYVLYNMSYAALSYPAGVASDRMPRRVVFASGLAVFAIAYVGLGLTTSGTWVWVLLPLYGCYTAMTDGVSRAWIVDLVPEAVVGTGLGTYAAISGVGAFTAGLWAGLAWDEDGRLPLMVSGVVTALLAVVLFAGGRWLDPVGGRPGHPHEPLDPSTSASSTRMPSS